jgi:capsular polysaccharide biosynthesis protein
LAALGIRRPRGVRQLAGFAVAGCVLAAVASYLIPNRYTSTAVMLISPAVLTSVEQLSKIIQDPRLNLYSEERARKPIEDVVREMLARDLRIAAMNPASGVTAAPPAFSISFSYSDRTKAHDVVQTLIVAFQKQHITRDRDNALQKGDKLLLELTQRKAGEGLWVLDPPSLPITPVTPNRLLITAIGLGIGLLVAAVTLILRRPHTPALQPA